MSADERIETIRQAHANAMEALGADVHPYSVSAIRAWEAEMDAALAAVAAELAGAHMRIRQLEEHNELQRIRAEYAERALAGSVAATPGKPTT